METNILQILLLWKRDFFNIVAMERYTILSLQLYSRNMHFNAVAMEQTLPLHCCYRNTVFLCATFLCACTHTDKQMIISMKGDYYRNEFYFCGFYR